MEQREQCHSLSRPPSAQLRPFVDLIWASHGARSRGSRTIREYVAPTGSIHIVLRLGETPLRIYDGLNDQIGVCAGMSSIGGTRTSPYLKDASTPEPAVGILLRPGAAELIIGAPAFHFTGKHTPLDTVWPTYQVEEMRERLLATACLNRRLALIDDLLVARFPRVHGIDPLVAQALSQNVLEGRVSDLVEKSGFSHRHFTKTFRNAVGITPKAYMRIQRFGRVVKGLQDCPTARWADLAIDEGYSDQAHMTRDFRSFAGVTPEDYRRLKPVSPHHIRLHQHMDGQVK